jgi:TolA-binding protein
MLLTKKADRQEAHVRSFLTKWSGMAVVAVCGVVLAAGTVQLAHGQAAKKNWKDQAEYDLFNSALKEIGANNFAKAISELDSWKQKYPASDFKDEATVLYVQAYAGAKQPGKAIDVAGELIDKGVDDAFADPATGPGNAIKVLYTTAIAITQVPEPTPQELATGDKAAHQLLDYNRAPQGVAADAWAKARSEQLQPPAKIALMHIAMLPGNVAFSKKDWAAAEAAYTKALQQYPENSAISWQLGLTMRNLVKTDPSKRAQAAYEFQRAVVIDATLGGGQKASDMTNFADQYYSTIHGSNEGLDGLKVTVKASPLPPGDFKIKTATEIAEEKEKEFEKTNPELALWLKIKGALADANGEQYFSGQLKDSAVPKMKGTIVDAKCRAKEILVAIPLPDAQGAQKAEITLKLDAPVTGKPEAGSQFQWDKGIPSAFTKDPFMLTMDVEKANLEGLKTSPCTTAPAGTKKGGPTKKKAE